MLPHQDIEGLSALNPSPKRLSGSNFLHQLIQSPSYQERPAVDFLSQDGKRRVVTYTELHTLSDVLAARIVREARLRERPNGPDDQLIIPLMIPQGPELYVAILAILKAGGAFCPLNLDAPPDRIRFILDDIKATLILATNSTASKLSKSGGDAGLITVDAQDEYTNVPCNEHKTIRPISLHESDLAYVMYTSGSTGTPKGVGISHLAVTQSLLAHDRHVPNFDRFLQFAAPTFDVSVFEIFFPLLRGSTLVCCDRGELLTDLPKVMREMEVDACELTPSVAGSLLKNKARAPCLRLLLTIGEMLTEPVVREFGGDAEHESLLWGMYGPTEAAIHW